MKNSIYGYLIILITLAGCKANNDNPAKVSKKNTTILEQIAQAHGYDQWQNVESISFTFNVDRDSSHFERTWHWTPKSNDVLFMALEDTLSYSRKVMDSIISKTDAGFINDKYWLLAPYQLVWDQKNFTYDHEESVPAPISKDTLQRLSIVYGNTGGYTPGDAYDFYFGNDYKIREWVFRKGNQVEPSMTTTWEDYKNFEGLEIATLHKMDEGNFKLFFTDVEVKLREN